MRTMENLCKSREYGFQLLLFRRGLPGAQKLYHMNPRCLLTPAGEGCTERVHQALDSLGVL